MKKKKTVKRGWISQIGNSFFQNFPDFGIKKLLSKNHTQKSFFKASLHLLAFSHVCTLDKVSQDSGKQLLQSIARHSTFVSFPFFWVTDDDEKMMLLTLSCWWCIECGAGAYYSRCRLPWESLKPVIHSETISWYTVLQYYCRRNTLRDNTESHPKNTALCEVKPIQVLWLLWLGQVVMICKTIKEQIFLEILQSVSCESHWDV